MGKVIQWNYDLVNEYLRKLGYTLISKEYKNNKSKLVFKDKNGYLYYMSFETISRGNKPKKFHKTNIHTIHNIKLWCKLENKPFELISVEFKGVFDNLQWKCLKDGCTEEFEAIWHDTLDNCGCPYCCIPSKKIGLSNCLSTKNPELALEWHPTKNGSLTPYDVTCGSNKYAWWQCKNGHEWPASIYSRENNGCPYCAGQLPTKENNLLVINPTLCEEWNYKKNDKNPEEYLPFSGKRVWWECQECKHEWDANILNRSRINGTGCPKCNESKGEKSIDRILTQYNIFHGEQYTFSNLIGLHGGLLRFDSAIFWDKQETQLRLLLEYDGIFHYEKQYDNDGFEALQIHDKLKNEYCIKNNIILIRIPYWDFDNIEEILTQTLQLNNNTLTQQTAK